MNTKNVLTRPIQIRIIATVPQTDWVWVKSSTLVHVRFCHAHFVPLIPNTIFGIRKNHPRNSHTKNAHQQPLKNPQIGYSPKAPQFHFDKFNGVCGGIDDCTADPMGVCNGACGEPMTVLGGACWSSEGGKNISI